jgi:hypothetical protein
MKPQTAILPVEGIATLIRPVRGQRVILDTDLASLYGVPTFRFNEAVKRNLDRFPEDFMFRLTQSEWKYLTSQFAILNSPKTPAPNPSLTSQIAILKPGRGQHRKYPPYAFTEHGALMAANILSSPRAVAMGIYVIRAFVQFRQVLASHADLARKLATLEKKYDTQFKVVFDAIRELMTPPRKPKREIGFHTVKK